MKSTATPGNDSGRSCPWRQLPTAVQTQILSLLPPNDRALSGRLVSPDARDGLSGPEDCTASLSQPLPPHAAPWAVEAGQQHVRQLPFGHKLQLMCTAAASGSEVNLEVALALLQPSIFPDLLESYDWDVGSLLTANYCPGQAAAKAGHLQLLPWLVRRCPGLMWPGGVLKAAARHCDLAGLQIAWEALQHGFSSSSYSGRRPVLSQDVLDAAAESSTPDAVAKLEWLLRAVVNGAGEGDCRLQTGTAAAAARSGDLGRLRWLRDQGCPMGCAIGPVPSGQQHVLGAALKHAGLAVAQWLVDEAGCGLPGLTNGDIAGEERDRTWTNLMQAAAESADAVAKWQWLQKRGGPSVAGAEGGMVRELVLAAVRAGQVQAVQYLLSVLGAGKVLAVRTEALSRAAALSGSIPVAECLQQAGLVFWHEDYIDAAGHLPFVRWLALEADLSANDITCTDLGLMIGDWPDVTPAHSQDLQEAVQLLVGIGFSDWDVDGIAIDFATSRGELDLVLYLKKHGAPLDVNMYAIMTAATAGCEPLLEFLTAQPDCFKPSEHLQSTPYIVAASHGDRATLDALRRLGVPWGGEEVMVEAVKRGCREPALRWLVEHGAPVGSPKEMEAVVATSGGSGSLGAEVVAWLRGLAAGGSGGA